MVPNEEAPPPSSAPGSALILPAVETEPLYLEDRTAGAYLTQSREALLDCGRPNVLYPRNFRDSETIDLKLRLQAHLSAQTKQIELARTSILFAALAAEAYVNTYLGNALTGPDFEAVDRLPTLEKFVLGPELVLGRRLFSRGDNPGQAIGDLFRLRHQLVHPKGGKVRVERGTLMDPRFESFNAEAAARFIVEVAAAATEFATVEERQPDRIVRTITTTRDQTLAFGEAMKAGLPKPIRALGKVAPKVAEPGSEPRPDPPLLKKLKRARIDPLKPPETVPQEPIKLLDILSPLPGTATGPTHYRP